MSIWSDIVDSITGSEAVYNTSDEPDWDKVERKGIEPAGKDHNGYSIWKDRKGKIYYYGELPRRKARSSGDEDGGVVNSEVLNNSGGNGSNTPKPQNQGYTEYGKPVNFGAPEPQEDPKVKSHRENVLTKHTVSGKKAPQAHNPQRQRSTLPQYVPFISELNGPNNKTVLIR